MADASGEPDEGSISNVDSTTKASASDVISGPTEGWCETRLKVVNIPYKWTIDNFSLRPEALDECIATSTFSASEMEQVKWCLHLYPKGSKISGYLSMFLMLIDSDKPKQTAMFSVSIVDKKGNEAHTRKFKTSLSHEKDKGWGWQKFISLDILFNKKKAFLHDDKLTLSCKVGVIGDSHVASGSSNFGSKGKLPGLLEQLGKLYTSKLLCDVVLSASGRKFECHKAVLAARSPVFAAMFESDMKERRQNRVEITDITPEVMQVLLEFVYTESCLKIKKLAPCLLAAADKYAVEDLKVLCEECIAAELTIQNAADTLNLADRHSASYLKAVTLNFLTNPSSKAEVMKTSAWKALVKSNPSLSNEVHCSK